MKLAILIGVTDYASPVAKLPACSNDLALITQLIRETGKFNDVLELGDDTSSAHVKAQLAEFVTKHEGKVDELFFYYSGHGDLYKEDFYFLFSDFSDKHRNQTSLTTEELDSMLRTLSPELTIKVVDACHAGVTYVKEPDALTKQLKISTGRFSNCHFMFSSQSSQASLQDNKLSDFTREFVQACTTFRGKDIRYKDIVDHISDAFATNSDQTPTFVIQAPCTEIFCGVDKSIRRLLNPYTKKQGQTSAVASPSDSTIGQVIKDRASEYCAKEQVYSFLEHLASRIKNAKFSGELRDSYNLHAETRDGYAGIPNLGPIGTWVKDNGADFFAKPVATLQTFEVEDPFSAVYFSTPGSPRKTITETREVVTGVDCTADIPFKSIWITAEPLFPNLPHAVATAVFVFSKRDFVLFYAFQTVREVDWGKLAALETRKWTYSTRAMKTDLDGAQTSRTLVEQFETFLTKEVKQRLGLTQEEPTSAAAGKPAKLPAKTDESAGKEKERAAK